MHHECNAIANNANATRRVIRKQERKRVKGEIVGWGGGGWGPVLLCLH